MTTARLVSTAVLTCFFLGTIPAHAQTDPNGRFPGALRWDRLNIGDVIAIGERVGEEPCFFKNGPSISIPVVKGRKRAIDVRVRENCQLVVAGKSEALTFAANRRTPEDERYQLESIGVVSG